jgi:N-dimethylarginine dimethylaminohydrolase
LATLILERPWRTAPPASHSPAKFKVDSEFGVLEAVLLCSPDRLRLVACNAVSEQSLRCGRATSATRAASQHRALALSLAAAGVEVHIVPSSPGLPDLAFARDSSFMTPWGLIGLSPGATHRRGEVDAVLRAAAAVGVAILGRIGTGRVEGGDICLLRPGVVAIGISEDRTDRAGAEALGGIFSAAGWETIYTRVDPALLHLDTHFCMLDRGVALGCTEALDGAFLEELARLDIEIIPVEREELDTLGCNVLALGRRRIISSGSAPRVDEAVRRRGFAVSTVALDEFTQCGGGVHCLTMPLARRPG